MASPVGWLHRVGVNEVNSHFRRLRTRRRIDARLAADDHTTELGDIAGVVALREAMTDLPDRQRLAIVLFHLGDLTVTEVAAAMGSPEGTVKSLLSRGRKALRAALTDPADTADTTGVRR